MATVQICRGETDCDADMAVHPAVSGNDFNVGTVTEAAELTTIDVAVPAGWVMTEGGVLVPGTFTTSDSVSLTDSGAITGAGDDPQYGDDAGDVLIFQDAMEYDCISTASCGNALGDNWSTNEPAFTTWARMAIGGGRTGNAVELRYGDNQAADLVMSRTLGGTITHLFFTAWFKTTVGWDPSTHNSSGIKGFMLPREGGARYQIGASRLRYDADCGSYNGNWAYTVTGTPGGVIGECGAYVWSGRVDNQEGPPWNGRSGTAFPDGFNDGEWHRWTVEYLSTGSNKYSKWWADGILVWDDEGQNNPYTSPNYRLRFFGNYSSAVGAEDGSIFFDDVTVWKR